MDRGGETRIHWEDGGAGLAEAVRVLKPGGRLIVSDEEPGDGQWGQGEGRLSDPDAVIGTIEGAGFIDAKLTRHEDGEVKMLSVSCRKPSDPTPDVISPRDRDA